MIKKSHSAVITFVLTILLAAAFLVLCFIMPNLLGWYYGVVRIDDDTIAKALLIVFYVCVPGVGLALYNIMRLLLSIYKGEVFTYRNVTRLRAISWCCAYVGAATLVGGIIYLPLLIVCIGACFMCLIVRVVKNVMAYAVDIKEENELTI